MSGGDHLVVNRLFRRAQMAAQAYSTAHLQIPCVVHAKLDGLLVRPVSRGMRAEPSRCRAVTVLATDTLAKLEGLGLLLWGHIERMANQAFPGFLRRADFKDRAHILGNSILQGVEGAHM